MGRNYLTGRDGDCINAVLAAAGYNFSKILANGIVILAAAGLSLALVVQWWPGAGCRIDSVFP